MEYFSTSIPFTTLEVFHIHVEDTSAPFLTFFNLNDHLSSSSVTVHGLERLFSQHMVRHWVRNSFCPNAPTTPLPVPPCPRPLQNSSQSRSPVLGGGTPTVCSSLRGDRASPLHSGHEMSARQSRPWPSTQFYQHLRLLRL